MMCFQVQPVIDTLLLRDFRRIGDSIASSITSGLPPVSKFTLRDTLQGLICPSKSPGRVVCLGHNHPPGSRGLHYDWVKFNGFHESKWSGKMSRSSRSG